jgi:S1-C subfamily serine protease
VVAATSQLPKPHSKMIIPSARLWWKNRGWVGLVKEASDMWFKRDIIDHHNKKCFIGRISIVFVCLMLSVLASTAKAEHGPQTWKAAHQSVVIVNPTWPGYTIPGHGAPAGTAPAGSGVYFAENRPTTGYILTAAHVISRATHIEIVDSTGRTMPADIHAVDQRRDIAILKTDLVGPVIAFGPDEMPIGSHVCAIGNSFGLGHSISCGVVSAVNRQNIGFNDIEDFIQTDAAINPGSSGGALIDSEGRFVGLIDGIFTKDADIDAGVNFAISLSLIRAGLAEMRLRGVRFDETK